MTVGYGTPESIVIYGNANQPTRPTSAGTTTLFDSYAMFGPGQFRYMNATMLFVSFDVLDQDSGTNGFISYTPSSYSNGVPTYTSNTMRDDSGSATMPITVSSSDAPRTFRFQVAGFQDFKLVFTAGATPPSSTGWHLTVILQTGNLSVTV